MWELGIYVNAVFFFIMGVVALARPHRITAYLSLPNISPPMRNEVRAVYGGFGVAVAGLLAAALFFEPIRVGVVLSIGVALLGMASGRVFSFLVDRNAGGYPLLFMFMEFGLAGLLLYSFRVASVL